MENQSDKKTELSFGDAVTALKDGKRIGRELWLSAGLFVFKQVPAIISMEMVPKMQSLPPAVKRAFELRQKNFKNPGTPETYNNIYYDNQLAIVDAHNNIAAYQPTVADIIATDWCILD